MSLEGSNSYKNKRDRELLSALNRAILILKLRTRKQLFRYTETEVIQSKDFLHKFLDNLHKTAKFIVKTDETLKVDFDYISIAKRFLQSNSHDIESALDNLLELRNYIQQGNNLEPDDFAY